MMQLVSLILIHWIEIYPMDTAIHLFEQLGPEVYLDFPFNLIGKWTMTFLTDQSLSDLNLGTEFRTQNKDFGVFCRWT